MDSNDLGLNSCKALCEGLRSNGTITSLSLSNNNFRTKSAAIIAETIPTMGALETITFGDKQAVTMKADMTAADLSGKELGASGAIIVAAFLPKCQ